MMFFGTLADISFLVVAGAPVLRLGSKVDLGVRVFAFVPGFHTHRNCTFPKIASAPSHSCTKDGLRVLSSSSQGPGRQAMST